MTGGSLQLYVDAALLDSREIDVATTVPSEGVFAYWISSASFPIAISDNIISYRNCHGSGSGGREYREEGQPN